MNAPRSGRSGYSSLTFPKTNDYTDRDTKFVRQDIAGRRTEEEGFSKSFARPCCIAAANTDAWKSRAHPARLSHIFHSTGDDDYQINSVKPECLILNFR